MGVSSKLLCVEERGEGSDYLSIQTVPIVLL